MFTPQALQSNREKNDSELSAIHESYKSLVDNIASSVNKLIISNWVELFEKIEKWNNSFANILKQSFYLGSIDIEQIGLIIKWYDNMDKNQIDELANKLNEINGAYKLKTWASRIDHKLSSTRIYSEEEITKLIEDDIENNYYKNYLFRSNADFTSFLSALKKV